MASAEVTRPEDIATSELAARVWIPQLVQQVAKFLHPNAVACTLRLVNRASADQFHDHKTVLISHPCPEHAFRDYWRRPGVLRPYGRTELLDIALRTAATGSLNNLKTALEVLVPALTGEPLAIDEVPQWQLSFCLRNCDTFWLTELIGKAASASDSAAFWWLLVGGVPCGPEAVIGAVRGNNLDLVDLMVLEYPHVSAQVKPAELLETAAKHCGLPVLQQLYSGWVWEGSTPGGPPHQQQGQGQGALQGAVQQQQQQQQGLDQEGPGEQQGDGDQPWAGEELAESPEGLTPHSKVAILRAAASSLTPDWRAKVVWLEDKGFPKGAPDVCGGACCCPDALERLAWLRQRGYPVDEETVGAAGVAGNLAAMEYLLDGAGVAVSADFITRHLWSRPRLDVLQALHARGITVLADDAAVRQLVCNATRQRDKDVVVWLLGMHPQEDAYLEGTAMYWAVMFNCWELVRWLAEERGCRLLGACYEAAARSGCVAMLEWLVEHGCPMQECRQPYFHAAHHNDPLTLRALARLGVPMTKQDDPYLAAARRGHVRLLRLLAELGYPFQPTGRTLNVWVRWGVKPEALRWLVEEAGCRPDWPAAVQSAEAMGGGNNRTLDWLYGGMLLWRQRRHGKRRRAKRL